HLRGIDLDVEKQPPCRMPVSERLDGRPIRACQRDRARGQLEDLAMPMENLLLGIKMVQERVLLRVGQRIDRMPPDLLALPIGIDLASNRLRQELAAETNAEDWQLPLDRFAHPAQLPSEPWVARLVVYTHGSAEHDKTRGI